MFSRTAKVITQHFVLPVLLVGTMSCTGWLAQPSEQGRAYPAPQDSSIRGGTLAPSSLQNAQTPHVIPVPIAPADAPQPTTGKSSLSGIFYSFTISRTLPSTFFYLTRGVGSENRTLPFVLIGPEESKGDISGKTDGKGQFSLNSVPPGNYFLVVSAPYNWSVVVISDKDFTPRLIELKANEKHPLGIAFVSWP